MHPTVKLMNLLGCKKLRLIDKDASNINISKQRVKICFRCIGDGWTF